MPVPKIGQRTRLSPHDIEEVRALYECSSSTYDRCGEDFEISRGSFQSPQYPQAKLSNILTYIYDLASERYNFIETK